MSKNLRDRQRAAVRDEITEVALELFLKQGFEETTIDQIVAGASVSRRSFFRYFGTKEDIVLGDLLERGRTIADAVALRPAHEDPWEAIRAGLLAAEDLNGTVVEDPSELALGKMLFSTPSLYARHLEKRLRWQELLVPLIMKRLGPDVRMPALHAAAIVSSSLSCIDVASRAWIASDGERSLRFLYDEAVEAIRS
jgi:AcrR family transcriptional regulator